MHCQVKIYEWATSLMGTKNMSTKVFIVVQRLPENRGHPDLMIIKQYLLTTKPDLLHSTALCRVSGRTGGTEWTQGSISYANSHTLCVPLKLNILYPSSYEAYMDTFLEECVPHSTVRLSYTRISVFFFSLPWDLSLYLTCLSLHRRANKIWRDTFINFE